MDVFLKSRVPLTNHKSFSNIVLPRKDKQRYQVEFTHSVYGQSNLTHLLLTRLDFDGPASFLTPAEHMCLFWNKNLPTNFGFGNTAIIMVKSVYILGYQSQITLICFAAVWSSLKCITTPILKNRYFKRVFAFLENFKFPRGLE